MAVPARRMAQQASLRSAQIPAPLGGLNTVDPGFAMPEGDCPVLYNMTAAENGLRSRLGYKEWCTGLTGASDNNIRSILPFAGSSTDGTKDRLFATTSSKIYTVGASSTSPTSVLTFAASTGDAGWGVSHSVVNSAGAHFLMYFDEVNGYHVYTESTDTWAAVAAGAGATQINGVTPGNLVFGTVWKNYVLFVEKNTSRMWFGAAPNSLYGTVTSFDFGSKFRHGGNLVGLWSWTNDGGIGIDDYLVAISSGGDVVIYQGTDPNSIITFGIKGVWFVGGVPKGRRIATDYGGDLLILSSVGVVPISTLTAGAETADTSQYATRKIGNLFNRSMSQSGGLKGWSLHIHPEDATLLITVPVADGQNTTQLAMSLLNRGWAPYRDLPMLSAGAWQRKLYFGTADGRVCINTGYLDGILLSDPSAFTPIQCSGITAFRKLGGGAQCQIQIIRPTVLSEGSTPAVATAARYRYDLTELAPVTAMPSNASNVWGTALWGVALWGGGFATTQPTAGSAGMGPDAAVAFRLTATARTVLVGFDVAYTQGGML